jgi:hypothetical protein
MINLLMRLLALCYFFQSFARISFLNDSVLLHNTHQHATLQILVQRVSILALGHESVV